MTIACQSHCGHRVAATVIVTTLLAPLTADLVFAGMVGALPDFAAADGRVHVPTETGVWVSVFMAIFALPFAYVIGGVQAALGGIGLALYGMRKGPPPLLLALALGLAAYGLGHLIGLYERAHGWTLAFMPVHLVPAVVCWFAVRPIWRGAQA